MLAAHGHEARLLDAAGTRGLVDSPTYLGGLWKPDTVMVEPARLAWGLRAACLAAGVRIFEQTLVRSLRPQHGAVVAEAEGGAVRADRAVLATNAFPALLRRLGPLTVPVYDYVLATEPLDADQRGSIGWEGRMGVSDAANQFHYYRLTRDDRILWGGYDAVHHFGSRIHPDLEQAGPTHGQLAEHFFTTVPQLEGVRFSHRWAGVIDTCTRFAPFFGAAHGGRTAYAMGYTGLGVASTRFGADVVLDLLAGRRPCGPRCGWCVRSRCRSREPLRSVGISLTRWSPTRPTSSRATQPVVAHADRLGLGFDS